MSIDVLFKPLQLPNGTVISNRIAKAAMEENMADADHAPGPNLCHLYQRWAKGGAGLIITGNVMIDSRALTGPGAVVLEDESQLPKFAAWAEAAGSAGAQVWMQLNHPGRQLYSSMGQQALGPSAIAVDIPGFSKMFSQPKEMNSKDILDVRARYVQSALLAERAGFSGVEIHAAHGYLLSQFLSPLSNCRRDAWGGSLRNRARLLLDIVRDVRELVKPEFCVAVKLNSADFQRGGFDVSDATTVVSMLNDLRVDLVELSGGSYEAPAMQGQTCDERTLAREAYFLSFAKDVAEIAHMPLMLTGGIRRKSIAQEVVDNGISMVGMATALALNPDLPNEWNRQEVSSVKWLEIGWKNKTLVAAARASMIKSQLVRMGNGQEPKSRLSPFWSFLNAQLHNAILARRYRKWVTAKMRA